MAIRNETGAHRALCQTARNDSAPRIGAHFYKPAPRRAARRVNRGPLFGFCVAFLFPAAAAIVAALAVL